MRSKDARYDMNQILTPKPAINKSKRICIYGAISTPAHLIFTKSWFYQSSSVSDLESTMGPGTIEKRPK